MYNIYADGELLYDPSLFHEGYGVIGPKLSVGLNKAGSLNFTLPPNNVMYGELKKLKTTITAFQNGVEIFRGRVLHDEKDFYTQKQTYCEGQLAYLLDSTIRPYTHNGTYSGLFSKLISYHNSHVESNKKFTVGKVTIPDSATTVYCESKDYPCAFDEITDKILNVVGGHLMIRNEGNTSYIDLLADLKEDGVVNTSTQVIEFGSNLIDLSEHITAENIYTVIIPLGATLEDSEGNSTDTKLTISSSSKSGGKDYIENATAVELFGRIERKVNFDDVTDADTLYTMGEKTLKQNIEMSMSLTLTAVDLHILNPNIEAIRVGDWVRVISHPHGLDEYFQCRNITYDMESPDKDEYSFGVDSTTLTGQQVSGSKSMKSSVSQVLSVAGSVNSSVTKVNQAYQNMDTIISQMPTDYVNTATFNDYKTTVDEKFSEVDSNYEELLSRIIMLEGGGT